MNEISPLSMIIIIVGYIYFPFYLSVLLKRRETGVRKRSKPKKLMSPTPQPSRLIVSEKVSEMIRNPPTKEAKG